MTIYAKQVDENTYCLVNEWGNCVGLDGDLAYHPYFYNGLASESQYAEFVEKRESE